MRVAYRHLVAAVVAVGVIACGSPFVPPAIEPTRLATAVSAPFDETWNAAIDAFASIGVSIETLDKSSGLIVPSGRAFVPQDTLLARALADCGRKGNNAYAIIPSPRTVKYNVVVRNAPPGSTVQVRAFYLDANGTRCSSKGLFESETESAIKQRAERSR